MKRWRIRAAGVGAVAFVLALGVPGTASAQSIRGPEHFTIIETNQHGGPVFATGTFNAVGTDVERSRNGPTGTGIFYFPNGTITVRHTDDNGGTQSFDPVACIATFHATGDFVATRGTGAYKGIYSSGEYTVDGTVFINHTATGCGRQTIGQLVTITADGSVSIP